MENGVALAAIAALTTVAGTLAWVVKYVLKDIKNSLNRNADATEELTTFMRQLNGKLRRAINETTEQK